MGGFFGAGAGAGGLAVTGPAFPGTAVVPGAGDWTAGAGPLAVTGVRPVKIRKKTALSPTMPRKTRIGVLLEPETERRCMGRGGNETGGVPEPGKPQKTGRLAAAKWQNRRWRGSHV